MKRKKGFLNKAIIDNIILFIFFFFLLFLVIFLSQLLLNDNNFNNLKQINNQSELNGFGNNNNNDNSNNEKDKPLFNAKVDDMVLNKKVNNKITYLYLSFEVKSENEDIKDMIEENKIEILDKIIIHFDNMYKIDFSNKSDKEFLKSELINLLNETINDKEALIKDLYFTKYLIKVN